MDTAIKEFEVLLSRQPRDTRAQLKLADLYAGSGRVADACRMYSAAANALLDDGFPLKAVAIYKQILKRNPASHETRRRLVEVYRFLGLMNEAAQQEQLLSEPEGS